MVGVSENNLRFLCFCRIKYDRLRSAFDAMTGACKNVLHHPGLRDFLGLVLKAGNFLNTVSIQVQIEVQVQEQIHSAGMAE